MAKSSKKRQAASSIKIDPNVRCLRIYPVEDNRNSTKTIADRHSLQGVRVLSLT
jgi:hypothetical protein